MMPVFCPNIAIFDEAHTVEAVAADHLGLSVSEGQVDYLLNRLYNDQSQRGLLVTHSLVDAQKQVQKIRSETLRFFQDVGDWAARFCKPNGRLSGPMEIDNRLSAELTAPAIMIAEKAAAANSEANQVELQSASDRCKILADNLLLWTGRVLAIPCSGWRKVVFRRIVCR